MKDGYSRSVLRRPRMRSTIRRFVRSQGATGVAAQNDGQHYFYFLIGSWNIHLKRLLHPLSGSNDREIPNARLCSMPSESNNAQGQEPDEVATIVLRSLESRSPKARYVIGNGAGFVVQMGKFATAAVFDRGLRRQFNLTSP
jgi:hypothetical protein